MDNELVSYAITIQLMAYSFINRFYLRIQYFLQLKVRITFRSNNWISSLINKLDDLDHRINAIEM